MTRARFLPKGSPGFLTTGLEKRGVGDGVKTHFSSLFHDAIY
jgi:hypothetical protein